MERQATTREVVVNRAVGEGTANLASRSISDIRLMAKYKVRSGFCIRPQLWVGVGLCRGQMEAGLCIGAGPCMLWGRGRAVYQLHPDRAVRWVDNGRGAYGQGRARKRDGGSNVYRADLPSPPPPSSAFVSQS